MKKRNNGYQIKEQEHFDRLAETTGKIWWGSTTPAGIKRLQRRAHLIAQKLARFRDPVVLELGCGTGALTKFALEQLPLLRLISCDISSKAIQIAADRCAGYQYIRFGVVDATSIPYATGTFDAIIGNSVLHHLPIEISLRESFRVLKPGGIIFFFEPNMLNPQVAIEKNVRFIGRMLQNTEDETAFFRWPLAKILRAVGFYTVSVQPFDFLHPIVPSPLIGLIDNVGRLLERIPVLREISGSLLINACKLDSGR